MAITTDVTYEVKYNGTTVDEIGQSKTLNLLTSTEIEDFLYCGCYNNTMSGNLYPYTTDAGSYDTWNSLNDKYMPFKTDAVTGTYMEMLPGEGSYNDTTENGRYVGVVLVVDTTGEGYVNSITQSNAAKYRIVTEFDARNYYLAHTGNFSQVDGYGATDWDDENAGLYNYDYAGEVLHYVYDDNGTKRDINLYGEINVFPYAVFVDGNDLLYLVKLSSTILQLSFKSHLVPTYNAGYCLLNFTGNNSAENSLSITYNCLNFGSSFTDNGSSSYNWPYPSTHDVYKYHKTDKELVGRTHFQYHDFETAYWFTKLEQLLWLFAAGGLKFKCNDIMYKPLISNNVVYGYTDDMTAESELDSYTGSTKHDIPVTPPTPPGPSGDDPSDDQASGGIYGGAQGMCNLYYMTASEIKNLQNWFRGTVFAPGIQIPADFDPSNQLIGLMAFPIELGGSVDSTTITFRTADNQSVDTGVSCQKAYGDDLKFDMGTIDIPARMAQRGVPFLDYSCQVEVYIPFCDVVQLDVQQVIGTTLTCEMWISPATGDVSAMLSSGTHPVAYTSGNCAQQLPISVSSYGAIAGAKLAADHKMTQAVFQAAQNVVKDITNAGAIAGAIGSRSAINSEGMVDFSQATKIQGNMGLAGAAGVKAAGTVVNTALGLTAQNFDNKYALSVAKNSAPTHVSGSFGACTSWHFPNYCYVKITRPHFQKPDNYGHTEAVPVVATKPLSSLSGLTTCVNPDVSGIGTATMQELETIKGYLMSGVIL